MGSEWDPQTLGEDIWEDALDNIKPLDSSEHVGMQEYPESLRARGQQRPPPCRNHTEASIKADVLHNTCLPQDQPPSPPGHEDNN